MSDRDLFVTGEPRSKKEIATTLARLGGEITSHVDTFDDDEFFSPQGASWSPAGHLRHLSKSVRAVARGMGQPKWLLLVFGVGRRSRTFVEVRQRYEQALAAGGQAGGYAPSAATPGRELVMERWREACGGLEEALESWSERALDRFRLPHPLIGKLTVREMLFFTLHHNAHHARRVVERRVD